MKTKQDITKSYIIPMDVMNDILILLLKNNIPFQIELVNEKQQYFSIRVSLKQDSEFSKNAMDNIEHIVKDYGYYLNGAINSWNEEEQTND